MTARPRKMYGPHIAGPEGCTTAEVFGTHEGVYHVIAQGADGIREYDFRKGETPRTTSRSLTGCERGDGRVARTSGRTAPCDQSNHSRGGSSASGSRGPTSTARHQNRMDRRQRRRQCREVRFTASRATMMRTPGWSASTSTLNSISSGSGPCGYTHSGMRLQPRTSAPQLRNRPISSASTISCSATMPRGHGLPSRATHRASTDLERARACSPAALLALTPTSLRWHVVVPLADNRGGTAVSATPTSCSASSVSVGRFRGAVGGWDRGRSTRPSPRCWPST